MKMISIKSNFKKQKAKNLFLSDLVNFAEAIKNKDFTKKIVLENFHNLVDKNDYAHLSGSEKKELNNWLVSLLKRT